MQFPMNMVSIALLNTGFRVCIVLFLAPFIPTMEKIIDLLVKAEEEPEENDFARLEERFLVHPSLAIEQSRVVLHSMATSTLRCLNNALSLFTHFDEKTFQKVENDESLIDKYEDKLGNYLVRITASPLDPFQSDILGEYLHALTDLERVSDHALNIAEALKEKSERGISFSDLSMDELKVLISAIRDISTMSVDALIEQDTEKAYTIEPLEQVVDDLCDELKAHHIERIQDGICFYEHGFIYNDLLTDLERISDHCSNLAVAIIEISGPHFDIHEYSDSIREIRGEAFESLYNKFALKYQVKS